jgi:hypothetical protein
VLTVYANRLPGAIGTPRTCTRPCLPTAFSVTEVRYRDMNTVTTTVGNGWLAKP